MICDHPFQFFFALFILVLWAGIWLGLRVNDYRIRRLQIRLENARFELSLLDPRRGGKRI